MKKRFMTLKTAAVFILSLSMCVPAGAVTYTPEQLVLTDDFSADVQKVGASSETPQIFTNENTPAVLSDSWVIDIPDGYTSGSSDFEIKDGILKMIYKAGSRERMARVALSPGVAENIEANSSLSLKFGLINYRGETGTAIDRKAVTSNIAVRFAVRDDYSYYEIGFSGGSSSILSTYNLGTNRNQYTNRLYFRKVSNGINKYIVWDDEGDGGLYDMQIGDEYKCMDMGIGNGANISVTADEKTVTYSISGKNLNNEDFCWTGTYTDAEKIGVSGNTVQVLCIGSESGAAVDDVMIKNLPLPDYTDEYQQFALDFDAAVDAQDAALMQGLLMSDFKTLMGYYDKKRASFDYSVIENLPAVKISDLSHALIEYGKLYKDGCGIDVVNTLIGYINRELAAYELENAPDAAAVQAVAERNNEYYGFKTDEKAFRDNAGAIFAQFAGIENIPSLKWLKERIDSVYNEYLSRYIINKMSSCVNYRELREIIEQYPEIIGYNTAAYENIADKDLFAQSLMQVRGTLTDVTSLKNYIDGYVPPVISTPVPKPSYSGNGGGGGGFISPAKPSKEPETAKPAEKPAQTEPDTSYITESRFKDIEPSHWAYGDIAALSSTGVFSGYEDKTFRPNNDITNAEFIKVLNDAFGLSASDDYVSTAFGNDSGKWYNKYLCAAEENKIIESSIFVPDRAITREDIALYLYRAINVKGIAAEGSGYTKEFTDAEEISDSAYAAVVKLAGAGVIAGNPDGSFAPKSTATRAETARMINKTLELADKSAEQ